MDIGPLLTIIIIVAFILIVKKAVGGGKLGQSINVDKIVQKDKKTGEEFINCIDLGKAVGVDASDYYKKFTPQADFLSRYAGGALVGGSAGHLLQAQSFVGLVASSYKAGGLSSGVAFGGFKFDRSVRTIDAGLDHLKRLYESGELTSSEFTKAAAALAFNSGEGKMTGARDKFGELIFKDDTDRAIAAMVAQFFYEYAMPLDKVYNFLTEDSQVKKATEAA